MGTKSQSSIAILLCLNVMMFSTVTAQTQTCSVDFNRISQTNLCGLLGGLVNLEATVCLCLAINANVLRPITADLNTTLVIYLTLCGRRLPTGFNCTPRPPPPNTPITPPPPPPNTPITPPPTSTPPPATPPATPPTHTPPPATPPTRSPPPATPPTTTPPPQISPCFR